MSNDEIYYIKFLQNNAYISLKNGEIVILKNLSLDVKSLLCELKILNSNLLLKKSKFETLKKERGFWTESELDFLKENFNKYTMLELSEKLNKTIPQIETAKVNLRLYPIKYWSEKDVEFLRNNINQSIYYLSEKLNRSIPSIRSKIQWLNKIK
ncbi:hypothetical protein [Cetobacterium sp.]|uniref:hypothetical protein n=1 Tax=Cetobacterium sp. TaxID=2071632 RepID=UPI003F2FE333